MPRYQEGVDRPLVDNTRYSLSAFIQEVQLVLTLRFRLTVQMWLCKSFSDRVSGHQLLNPSRELSCGPDTEMRNMWIQQCGLPFCESPHPGYVSILASSPSIFFFVLCCNLICAHSLCSDLEGGFARCMSGGSYCQGVLHVGEEAF